MSQADYEKRSYTTRHKEEQRRSAAAAFAGHVRKWEKRWEKNGHLEVLTWVRIEGSSAAPTDQSASASTSSADAPARADSGAPAPAPSADTPEPAAVPGAGSSAATGSYQRVATEIDSEVPAPKHQRTM